MEVILDELRENGVDIDMTTLSHPINYLLERHEALYNQMVVNVNPNEMHVVFNTINGTNFVCAMAYLALVYFMHASEDTTRRAVRFGCGPSEKL
jgi:arginine repressor